MSNQQKKIKATSGLHILCLGESLALHVPCRPKYLQTWQNPKFLWPLEPILSPNAGLKLKLVLEKEKKAAGGYLCSGPNLQTTKVMETKPPSKSWEINIVRFEVLRIFRYTKAHE